MGGFGCTTHRPATRDSYPRPLGNGRATAILFVAPLISPNTEQKRRSHCWDRLRASAQTYDKLRSGLLGYLKIKQLKPFNTEAPNAYANHAGCSPVAANQS